VYTERSHLRK